MQIAVGVILAAQQLGVDRADDLRGLKSDQLMKIVQGRMYHPLLDLGK